jgi:hypothetical protein
MKGPIIRDGCEVYVFRVRFQVLMAMTMEMTAFWDMVSRNLIEIDVSEVHTASIIRAMNRTFVKNHVKI